jgi:hypothetical protein
MSDDVRPWLSWVRFEDYKRDDGTTDWSAYWAAQVANGERCDRCGAFLIRVEHKPAACEACKQLETDPGVCYHTRRVRCPHCSATCKPRMPTGGVLQTLMVDCEGCAQRFFVEVEVIYSYRSPARVSPESTQ